jgi:diguanylate cyclase (GGDEF)-like protein
MERITSQALADRRATNAAVAILVLELDAKAAWTERQRARVLRRIARELRVVTRASDFVARTGDGQFMALLPGSRESQARAVMARVHGSLARRLRERSVAGSSKAIRMAVVTAPRDGDTAEELFASAARAVEDQSSRARERRIG